MKRAMRLLSEYEAASNWSRGQKGFLWIHLTEYGVTIAFFTSIALHDPDILINIIGILYTVFAWVMRPVIMVRAYRKRDRTELLDPTDIWKDK